MTGLGSPASSGPTAPKRFISVGTKLSLSTSVLVLVVAAATYFGLSRYERENLLAAKGRTAHALVQLFAASLVAPLAFEDENSVADAVRHLGENPEIVHVRVWAADPMDADKLGRQVGALSRGPSFAAPAVLTKAERVTRSPESLLVDAPVTDPNQGGAITGAVQVALSLARENAQIQAIERKVLWVAGAVAVTLSLLLIFLARVSIIRPLTTLSDAAKQLEAGNRVKVGLHANDEIGQLGTRLQAMADAIAVREERIQAQNADMRVVLDNVDQGLCTIDREGRMAEERSKILDVWFGPPQPDWDIVAYLSSIEEELGIWFRIGWDAVIEDVLPLELTLEQLPKRFTKGERFYELNYRPIMEGERLEKTLLVIDDVTSRVRQEQADRDQRQLMVIFRHMISARSTFEDFLGEARQIMAALDRVEANDAPLAKRLVHTLKGNAAIFNLDVLSATCHEIESHMADTGEPLSEPQRRAIKAAWEPVEAACKQLSLATSQQHIELDRAEYEQFLRAIQAEVSHDELASIVSSWRFEPAKQRLEAQAELIRKLGSRLHKEVTVSTAPTALRLPARKWAPFWSSFAHIVRNALDHGIEPAEERASAGKPLQGTISLALLAHENQVELRVADDGRGIDWEAVRRKAASRGLLHQSREDLVEALFSDSFSTREQATETSGRGVGLGAVREAVANMGGTIRIASTPGQGTTFSFDFPRSVLQDGPSLSLLPPQPRLSARPQNDNAVARGSAPASFPAPATRRQSERA